MSETKHESGKRTGVEIETTDCPECGTNWEVVVTERVESKMTDHRKE